MSIPTREYLFDSLAALLENFRGTGYATFTDGGFPSAEFDALRAAGLLTVTLPGAALDAKGSHTPEMLRLLKLVGRGNLSVGRIYEGHLNALLLIHLYGTDAQRKRYYADARAGHLFGVWNTQMSDGVNFYRTADGGVTVVGSKSFCSGSTFVTRPIVTGVLNYEDDRRGRWQMTVLPLDRHRVSVNEEFWNPLGMRNSVSYKIDFTGVKLAAEELLGGPECYGIQPHFSGGAIRFAAVQLGGAEALLDATHAFLRQNNRSDCPHQRRRVGEMAILVESGNHWLEKAGRINDAETDTECIVTYANMTRTAIADICTQCLQLAERSIGVRGMLHPEPLARLHADLSTYLRQPAPDATLDQVGQYHLENEPTTDHPWFSNR